MTFSQGTALSERLEVAELALQTEKASHDRTLGDLHSVFRRLREARNQIGALERERDECRAELENQQKDHKERLRGKEKELREELREKLREESREELREEFREELRKHQAAFRKTHLEQDAIIDQQADSIKRLRAQVEEGTTDLELVLEQQDELRAERDAAIKKLQEIEDKSNELQELRGKMALTAALREADVKRESARAAAAEELRDMAIRKIKTLKESASETAIQHEKAITAAREEVSRQAQREMAKAWEEGKKAIAKAKEDCAKELRKMKPEVAAVNDAFQERSRRMV